MYYILILKVKCYLASKNVSGNPELMTYETMTICLQWNPYRQEVSLCVNWWRMSTFFVFKGHAWNIFSALGNCPVFFWKSKTTLSQSLRARKKNANMEFLCQPGMPVVKFIKFMWLLNWSKLASLVWGQGAKMQVWSFVSARDATLT